MDEVFFRDLYRIRRVEEEIARIYPSDKVVSPVHLSIGQEAISVAVCRALRPDDVVFGSYRCHAYYLAKGGDLNGMIAELYGKGTGCAKGKAGSMHLIDAKAGAMGASAVVATTIPLAVGYAHGLRAQGKDSVVVCFFGDGAVEEGVFHESLNFAALRRLPVLFVCENNGYAIHSPLSSRQPGWKISEFVKGYGIQSERFETMDLLNLHERASQVVSEMRSSGAGPWFFETTCYRWMEHVGPNEDFEQGYRSRADAAPWQGEHDEVEKAGARLSADVRRRIEEEVEAEIRAAFAAAEEAPYPAPDQLHADLYEVRA